MVVGILIVGTPATVELAGSESQGEGEGCVFYKGFKFGFRFGLLDLQIT